jgi:putative endopeptidase
VRNVDEFYESFDVTESDAMWLEPAARVTIW